MQLGGRLRPLTHAASEGTTKTKSAAARQQGAFEQHIDGAAEPASPRFGRFGRVKPLDELAAVTRREPFKSFPRFRVILQTFAQVGGNRKSSRSQVQPEFDAHDIARVGPCRLFAAPYSVAGDTARSPPGRASSACCGHSQLQLRECISLSPACLAWVCLAANLT